MKSFQQYMRESPTETEGVVPIKLYLFRDLDNALSPEDVQDILAQVRSQQVKLHKDITVPIASLIPTQPTVSQPKVIAWSLMPFLAGIPTVMMGEHGFYIIDGHHRICGAVVRQETVIRVNVVQSWSRH